MAQLFKEELRKEIKAKRKLLNIDCQMLVEKLTKTQEYKLAKNIMIFYPLKDEVDLLSLLKDKAKKFYLPKIDGENLLCCPYGEGDELCVSCFKTFEPVTEACDKNIVDLVIVPALCCDKNNYRLGYGGGFYDRFLGKYPKAVTVVPIAKELCVEKLPREDYDMKTDFIIKG